MSLLKFDKKYFLYEVDPLFFHDGNNDGYGDFEGFLKKIDYFDFLGIDGIMFPDIFNQEDIILKKSQTTIFDKYGNFKSLKAIVEELKKRNKDFLIQIDISKVSNSMLIKKTIDDYKNINIYSYIDQESSIQGDDSYIWSFDKNKESLKTIIEFWTKLGVNNFVLINFEQINENKGINSDVTRALEDAYKLIKEIDSESTIGLRSLFVDSKGVNNLFEKNLNTIFDFYVDSSYSLIGTNKKYPFDLLDDFKNKELFKKLKSIRIDAKNRYRYFVSFNNNSVGRVNSRWLNDEKLIDETSKSLLSIQCFIPFSTTIYYGDEIGMLHLDIKNQNDYFDYRFVEKKRQMESHASKKYNFEQSQYLLSKVHSQAPFIWNNEINGGYSKQKDIFRKLPINHKKYNLKNEYKDRNSILNYFVKSKSFINFSDFETINQKSSGDCLLINFINEKENINVIINFSNKTLNKKINKNWNVLFSNLPFKKYETNEIKTLNPYEVIVISKKL